MALEAACCCMQLLAAPNLPTSLYLDELLTATISLAKHHLQYNVLALHDPHYKRLYRPDMVTQGEERRQHGRCALPCHTLPQQRHTRAAGLCRPVRTAAAAATAARVGACRWRSCSTWAQARACRGVWQVRVAY